MWFARLIVGLLSGLFCSHIDSALIIAFSRETIVDTVGKN